ncbi:related to oligopeptide transporter [Sporisorium reilianum SRZ2]|uniref:Related to oligopeptide transporter n=1 Tax=Sporisorium reilianum (strain SRZ2) TaxID=999809 RepID=E6ZV57_SPORE|nr:related to oligopeptide transporter [Sporisorium reilianum SRZ2]
MSRPKTATTRPTTSAGGQLTQSFRPATSNGLDSELNHTDYDAEDDKEHLDSSADYSSTDDSYDDDDDQHHHAEDDDDDDVFAFAPPGLGIPAVQVVPAPVELPAPPPAALTAPESAAPTSRSETVRESVYYYDQNSGAVYNAQGDLVQMQTAAPPYAQSTSALPSVSPKEVLQNDEQKTSAPVSRSTSIKWHPSTRGESGTWPRRCESAGKDSEGPCSPTWYDGVSWNGHAGTNTCTSDSADLLRALPSPCFARAVELELEEDDDSPYPEVRASVSNVDDPTMPSITFRSLLLGLGLSAFASAVNTFLSQRNPPIQIVAIIVQILAHPLGTVMANVLPIRSFSFHLPSLRKGRNAQRPRKSYTWSFNPGPWNIKEHTVVLVAATTGLNPSYSLSILLAQDLARFWDDRRSFLYGLLSVCAPQLIGLAMAGFVREVLVEPASMIWPQNLSVSTVLNTLHAEEDAVHSNGTRRMSRLRFFNVASLIAFLVYFFPGYLFTALSIFNWVCWIWPTNVPVNVVFGAAHGLGASVLTFDWNQIVYLGSPLVIPWWAQANLFAGFVMGIWIAAPILYFTNALHTAYLPILSGSSFDRFGQRYNVSMVSSSHSTLRADAYANYSQVYISAGLIVAYFGGFALITAAVVHTTLYHGRFVWDRLRTKRAMPDDVHARLMRKYASVPFWWYGVVLAVGLGMSVFLTAAYSTHLPIWALGLAVLVPAAYMLPFGFIFAMSGLPAAVNLVSEILASWLLPGRPLPVMMFKTVSQQTLTFGLLFSQDQKLGHYMKIAPRQIFFVQILSILVNSFMQILAKNYLRDHIPDVCDPAQPQHFVCEPVQIFHTASIIWGAIGVERSFGPKSPYRWLFSGLIVGAVLPLMTWFTSRKLKWSTMRIVSAPIIFVGMSLAPPASGINFTSAIVVGYFFQYWMRKHRLDWWSRYNFVLAGALDFGTVLSSLVIYFLLQMPKNGALELQWWGNQVDVQTADAQGVPLLDAPEMGFAPAPGMS